MTAINIWRNSILGKWNTGARRLLLAAGTSIVILARSAKTDTKYVFAGFRNDTNWPDGAPWLLSLVQSVLSVTALDVVYHTTEEMPNLRLNALRALLYTVVVGGGTILDAAGDIAILAMVLRAMSSRAVAATVGLLVSGCFVNGFSASITSVSRLFAMARDRDVVFDEFLEHFSPCHNVPVDFILFCYVQRLLRVVLLGPDRGV
ncbi:amino acid/polyamine transporter I [Cordyceps fumosorosea ARSEF 2679]|uniref:Amino acid/polyamine transporter I n=1 Tax=Cordyceps fumosorosea (strain ARSEF 2679) TaxID=1081104 RepID=A0A167KSI8_CORFA|nr:amino acid/polyamine transporter I [Cordyceps fumosorosea ARSEF 2679]OAA52131.1 amino acid/polyamine transporter I [Cordyceps fumosorosea ARSEF 2679]